MEKAASAKPDRIDINFKKILEFAAENMLSLAERLTNNNGSPLSQGEVELLRLGISTHLKESVLEAAFSFALGNDSECLAALESAIVLVHQFRNYR